MPELCKVASKVTFGYRSAVVTTYATGNMGRRGGSQYWLGDSRHIGYIKDPIGDENTRLLVQDTQAGTLAPWMVIAAPGARSAGFDYCQLMPR